MMDTEHPDIVTVNEGDFEYQVLMYSERIPVLVFFWAPWCVTCQRVNPLLETLAKKNSGQFRLAKVDVDRNEQLAQRYQVHTIPTLKTFENGLITRQIIGIQTDNQVVNFVKQTIPGPENLLLEKASSLYKSNQYQEVEDICRDILQKDSSNPRATLMLSKCLIWQGEYSEAKQLLKGFPDSAEFQQVEKLRPLVDILLSSLDDPSEFEDPSDAIYHRAIKLITLGNIPAALDGLLGILRTDKRYRGGLPRDLILGIFELLGDNHPLTQEYRPLLANILF